MTSAEECLAAARHWEQLADADEAQAKWNREHGLDMSHPGTSAGDYRAQTYRRTAACLRLEAETGLPHCSTCLGAHPNHLHHHFG
jgi:hypothetical protein